MKQTTLLVVFTMCLSYGIMAQQKMKLQDEFDNLRKVYQRSDGLHWDLKYVYYGEQKKTILDSVKGEVTMYGNDYMLRLDSTETFHNKKYTIHLFHEDKLMHISKTPDIDPSNIIIPEDLSKELDSIKYVIHFVGPYRSLVIAMPEQSGYKEIELETDTATGLLVKTKYTLKTILLTGLQNATGNAMPDNEEEYSVVETYYMNYKPQIFSNVPFDESRFFTRSGKDFIPAKEYKDFSIFIGTPNL